MGYGKKSPIVAKQRLVNLYREPQREADKSSMALYGTPGLERWDTFNGTGCRFMYAAGGLIYAWRDGTVGLWVIRADGTAYFYGGPSNLPAASGRVSVIDNGQQLLFVDGRYGWTHNLSTHATDLVTDVDFPTAPSWVTFLAGYFIVGVENSGRFYWSSLYDGKVWSALDFATAESNPDNVVCGIQNGGQLYLLGDVTTEVWAPTGDAAVFRRVGGSGVDWGLAAKWTLDKFDGGLIFLAKNSKGEAQVVRMQGYNVLPISGPDENAEINERVISDASGFSYVIDGHSFYQLNFPDKSLLYDGLSNSWSEVSSNGGRHYGEMRAELNAQAYVTDYRDGSIYKVKKNVYKDGSDAIVRKLISRHIFANYDLITLWELFVDFETGIGITSGQGSDPQVMLRMSYDNGRTWGDERWSTIGKIGEYITRASWSRLGTARDFLIELTISDPVKVAIAGAGVRIG